jgi:hypothetical protein
MLARIKLLRIGVLMSLGAWSFRLSRFFVVSSWHGSSRKARRGH